jgi:hypothetical protein
LLASAENYFAVDKRGARVAGNLPPGARSAKRFLGRHIDSVDLVAEGAEVGHIAGQQRARAGVGAARHFKYLLAIGEADGAEAFVGSR